MKRLLTALLFVVTFPLAAQTTLTASLSGANEVGGGAPNGAGLAVVTFNGAQVTYTILASGFDASANAHIHVGAASSNGNIVVDFHPTFVAGTATGTVTADAGVLAAILANPAGYYVNVHSGQFPNGAVRGQLSAAASNAGGTVSWLPVVGKSRGANATNFVTDLRIVNDSGATANVTLDFYRAGAEGHSAPTATSSFTVAAGEEKVLDDVIATTFSLDGVLGGLKVTSDRNVVVSARILNDLRADGKGTTGLSVAASDAGATSGILPFLSQASDADFGAGNGFRTNIGYFNNNATPAAVTFTARRASNGAVLGTTTLTIPAFGMVQQGVYDLLSGVPAADRAQSNFYISWTSTAPLFVYASVVDNKTGDSVFID